MSELNSVLRNDEGVSTDTNNSYSFEAVNGVLIDNDLMTKVRCDMVQQRDGTLAPHANQIELCSQISPIVAKRLKEE